MKTFKEYADSYTIDFNPGLLDFSLRDSKYCIFEGPKQLLTPGGTDYSHPSEGMIRLIITDMQLFSETRQKGLSSPVLVSFGKDIISSEDPLLGEWEKQLVSDLVVLIKTTGRSSIQPFGTEDPLFEFSFISLSGLIENINEYTARVMGEVNLEESDPHPFPAILKLGYERLYPEQRAAFQALSSVHSSGIVLPFLLVSGEITPVEYVKGLISLKIQPKELFFEILSGVAGVQSFLSFIFPNRPFNRAL